MKNTGGGKKIVAVCFFFFWAVCCLPGLSQVAPGDPGGGGDMDVPISGIEWLLVAGGIFGLRKIYNRTKKG